MAHSLQSNRCFKLYTFSYLAICLGIALIFLYALHNRVLLERVPFDTDEADHALAGLEMYTAFSNKDVGHIIRAFTEQAFYPPVHSLVLAVTYAFSEPSWSSSRMPSVYLLAFELMLIGICVFRLLNNKPMSYRMLAAAVGFIAATACYTAVLNSALCMLEPVGLVFVALMLVSLCGYEQSQNSTKLLLIAAVLSFLVCLSKYSFGIVVAPALPLALLFGKERTFQKRFNSAFWTGLITLICLVAWLSVTDLYAAWRFISGHPSSGPVLSVENLLYYPRAWFAHYSANPLAAVLLIALAAYGAFHYWSRLAVRTAFFIFLLGAIAFTISTTDEIRHFLVVTPGVWICAALGVCGISERIFERRQQLGIAAISLGLLMIISSGMYSRYQRLQKDLNEEFEGLRVFAHLQEYLAQHIDPHEPIIVSGMFDQFGNQALLWMLAKTHHMSYRDIQLDSYPFREETRIRARERKRNMPYPWRVENFPRSPLQAVIDTGHYKTAILLRHNSHPRFRTPEALEFRQLLESRPQLKRKTHGWSVTIYDLK